MFENLQCFLMFLGRGRSGSSLCGGLIQCHPNTIIAHQKEFKDFEFTDEYDLYNLLLSSSNEKQFIWKPIYGMNIEKLDIKVIGTKKQGTFIKNSSDFLKLDELKNKLSIPIKFINIYRNPFDNIATIYNESQREKHIKLGINMKDLNRAINYYFHGIQMTQEVIDHESVLNVKHEDVIYKTSDVVKEICSFLNLPILKTHLDICNDIVWKEPRETRTSVQWSNQNLKKVYKLKNRYEFLKDYSF